jgi:hypothetical protein
MVRVWQLASPDALEAASPDYLGTKAALLASSVVGQLAAG